MRPNTIRQIWSAGGCAVNAWLSIPAAYSAEGVGHQGVDCATVDLQHGMIDVQTAIAMLQAISATAAVPFARVGSNDGAAIMKLLDAGAYGIICPMISTAQDAESFARACRYPPKGQRSFGPARGLLYGGPDYFQHADAEVLVIAMVETKLGVENIDAILDVEHVDAIYVGPNDLSLDYGEPPMVEPANSTTAHAIQHILERTHAHGKKAGIFCSGGEGASRRRLQGFDLVTPNSDFGLLMRSMKSAADTARAAA